MLVLDIETAPTARGMAQVYPSDRQPPSNWKDPEKIAAWHLKDEADWRAGLAKECALSPRLGRVIAVGVKTPESLNVAVNLDERGEAELLTIALESVFNATLHGGLATFNGLAFDLPFIHVRAAILGIEIPYAPGHYLKRYTLFPHADLRAVLTNWEPRTSGTLHEWCEAFGIPTADETTGADIGAMVETGNVDGIRAHCASDVELAYALACKLDAAKLLGHR